MRENKQINLFLSAMLILCFCNVAYTFSGKTHKALTDSATLRSHTSAYLKNSLGINEALASRVTLDQAILPVGERIPTAQFEERISGE